MRRGFMGMVFKPRCNRRSGWGKGLLDQKQRGRVLKRSKCCWLYFLIRKDYRSWICTTWSDRKEAFVPGSFIVCLKDAVRRKRPELWENQTWMLHHDNAPAYAALLIRSYLAKYQTSVEPHPPYYPDLAPAEFFLFPKLKPLWKDVVSKP